MTRAENWQVCPCSCGNTKVGKNPRESFSNDPQKMVCSSVKMKSCKKSVCVCVCVCTVLEKPELFVINKKLLFFVCNAVV